MPRPTKSAGRSRAGQIDLAAVSANGRAAKERRPKAARPIVPHPGSSERNYADDESELIRAMREYQDRTGVRFPTWGEVLAIVKQLGYRKP